MGNECIDVMAHMNAAMVWGSLAGLFAGILIGAAIQRFVSRGSVR